MIFVLVKSIYQPDPKNDKTWLEFYSLYIGLAPLSAFEKRKCMKVLPAKGTFDAVVKSATALKIKAGDAIGFLGEDIAPAGMAKTSSTYAHSLAVAATRSGLHFSRTTMYYASVLRISGWTIYRVDE